MTAHFPCRWLDDTSFSMSPICGCHQQIQSSTVKEFTGRFPGLGILDFLCAEGLDAFGHEVLSGYFFGEVSPRFISLNCPQKLGCIKKFLWTSCGAF